MKKLIGIIISLILSYFAAYPLGHWFDSHYASGSWLYLGSFPGYMDGFLFSYLFSSSFLVSIFTDKLRAGLYAALPVLLLSIISGSFNPQLWIDLVLLAAGLGLAWIILYVKNQNTKEAASKTKIS